MRADQEFGGELGEPEALCVCCELVLAVVGQELGEKFVFLSENFSF